jgi:hypothetical protein
MSAVASRGASMLAAAAPPLGFGSLRRHQLGRSVHRFTSPAASALRVPPPLSGLLSPGPCGLVSCHSRPWDSTSSAFPTRSAVPPSGGLCPLAVGCGTVAPRPRLQGFAPTERPFARRPRLSSRSGPVRSWPFPLRGLPTRPDGPKASPHALARRRAPGSRSDRAWERLRESSQPPWSSSPPSLKRQLPSEPGC